MGSRHAAAERLTLPKVDIHVHLEGAIRPATLMEVAGRDGTPLPTGLQRGSWSFAGFEDFIAQYDALDACLGELDDLRRFAYELCADEAAEGVRYAEVTFTISSHARRLGDWHEPIEAVLDGFASGRRDFGVECQLVLDIAPVLLGSGERIFDDVPDPGFVPAEVGHSPAVTHIRYRVER